MPKIIQLPSQEELPAGAHRRFAETLYRLWSEAGMPAATKVSERIQKSDLEGSASKETVRRMLTGKVVPQEWANAEAVFVTLSQMAGTDPDRAVTVDSERDYGVEFGPEPARALFRRFWRDARGGGDYAHAPMQDAAPPSRGGGFGGGAFSDEPPF